MFASLCKTETMSAAVKKLLRPQLLVVCLLAPLVQTPAGASDLLIAPTRAVFEGRARTAEITLKNTGTKAATYRISLVARRMTPEGRFAEVDLPSAAEKLADSMIRYAPRRVHLEAGEYQAIRLAVRKPADLSEGEYRIHMLFRAVPDSQSLAEQIGAGTGNDGLAVRLIPIYGVTIPVIVRHGNLEGGARIAKAAFTAHEETAGVDLQLVRLGQQSFYSDIEVIKPGEAAPFAIARGIAIYHEIDMRSVFVPVSPDYEGPLSGPATIRLYEVNGNDRVLVEERQIDLG